MRLMQWAQKNLRVTGSNLDNNSATALMEVNTCTSWYATLNSVLYAFSISILVHVLRIRVYTSICLAICLPICPSVCPSVSASVCPSVCLSVCIHVLAGQQSNSGMWWRNSVGKDNCDSFPCGHYMYFHVPCWSHAQTLTHIMVFWATRLVTWNLRASISRTHKLVWVTILS